MTNPAAEKKSMGLPADTLAVMVFAESSGEFNRDMTTSRRLSGLSHLDSFIVTPKYCPSTGTMQKHMPALTRTATNPTTGPLVVIAQKEIDLSPIQFSG